jgi:hypothetical protein
MQERNRRSVPEGDEFLVDVDIQRHEARPAGEGEEHAAVPAPEVEDDETRPGHEVRVLAPKKGDGALALVVAGEGEREAALGEPATKAGRIEGRSGNGLEKFALAWQGPVLPESPGV